MIMLVVLKGGDSFIGRRGIKETGIPNHETQGCHHFTVLEGGTLPYLTGKEIAVPVTNVRYFILDYKKGAPLGSKD